MMDRRWWIQDIICAVAGGTLGIAAAGGGLRAVGIAAITLTVLAFSVKLYAWWSRR